ncbi:sodium-dependent glucose transporter 1C-like [Liolophura sinensis]|uniref:sodium-dependent glucose transporter 1C-like n=1 Tax=Liolophura sinensis TaxID=3198878 RepID=UPI003158EAB3
MMASNTISLTLIRNRVSETEQSAIPMTDCARKGSALKAANDGTPMSCAGSAGASDSGVHSPIPNDPSDSVIEKKGTELVLVVTGVTGVTGMTTELCDSACSAAGTHPCSRPNEVPHVSRIAEDLEGKKCCHVMGCDQEHFEKIKYTAFVFVVNIALGGLFTLTPTAFLDLLQQTESNVQQGSLMFIIGSLGYTLGSLVSGHLYDKLNVNVIFSISAILAGFFIIFIPMSSSLAVVISLLCLSKVFQGSLDSGSTLLCARIWGNAANPYQQAVTFFYALGGIITPFAMEPFLFVSKEPQLEANRSGHIALGTFVMGWSDRNDSAIGKSSQSLAIQSNSNLFLPFIIFGTFSVLTSMPFVLKVFCEKVVCKRDISTGSPGSKSRSSGISGKLVVFTLILIGAFFMAYGYLWGLGEYSMPFTVDYLGWSKKEGTQLNSVTWSALAAGCFVGIFVARCLRPSYMILVTLTPITLGLLALLLAARSSGQVVWIAYIFIFAGAGSLHPAAVSWVDQRLIRVNGKICSLFVVTMSLGDVTNNLLLGYLFQNDSPMWYVYLTFGSSVFQWMVLLGLYSTKFVKRGQFALKDARSEQADVASVPIPQD